MEREIKTEAEAQRRSMVATEEKKKKATREEGGALRIVIDFTKFLMWFYNAIICSFK